MIRPTTPNPALLVVSFLFVIAVGTAGPAVSAGSAPETAATVAESADEAKAQPNHPLAAEIVELRDATQVRLDALEELRRGALDAVAIRRVEAAISRTKLDFEIGVLELQRGQQRALGRAAASDELGAAIEALRAVRDAIEGPAVELPEIAEDTREGGR